MCNYAIRTAAMMMPKEGIVCFIVFLDNKNIWLGEKNQISISTIEKVMKMASMMQFIIIINIISMNSIVGPCVWLI